MTSPFLGSTSGRTRQQLRAARYLRLSRDLYVIRSDEIDLYACLLALQLALPGMVACGRTAAALLRLPVDEDGLLHIARFPDAGRSERPGVRTHRWHLPPQDVRELVRPQGAVRLTTGPRTWVDLAAEMDLLGLVAVGDVLVGRHGREALARAVRGAANRPGVPLLRRALPLLDAGCDSPAETRMRLRLHAAGFRSLRHGVVVRDELGGWLAAPDLADEQAKVAIQHDGAIHFQKGAAQRRHDVDRDELCREQGWQVVISTAIDDARPARLVRRVAAAYERSARGRP